MSTTRPIVACTAACAAIAALLTSTAALAVDQDAIKAEVAGMNDSLPAMVAPALREEKVRFNGAELAYTITRVGQPAANSDQLASTARAYLLSRLCTDPDTRQMMRDGIVFSFGYVNETGADTDRLLLNESDCAVLVQPGR